MEIKNGQGFCANVNMRKETHGDEKVAAVTVSLTGISIPVEMLDEFCPMAGAKLSEILYADENPILTQLYPLTLDLELEPYSVQINRTKMPHCTLKRLSITPELGRVCTLSLQVNTLLQDNFAAPLAKAQQEDVTLQISSAQADLAAVA